MMDAGEINFKIRPLEDVNFPQWSKEIKVILLERNLWEIVAEKEVEPTGEDKKLVNDFKIRKNKAFATIFMNVSKGLRPIIEHLEDPVLAWKKLKDYFQPDSRARTMALKNEFYSLKPEPNEKIAIYGSKLERIAEQLQESGHPIDEQDRCFQLLRFLPDEMENVIQNIYRWGDKNFTFAKVLEELIREEGRLYQRKADQATMSYAATTRKQGIKEKLLCFQCNRKGHFKRDCPFRGKEPVQQPRAGRMRKRGNTSSRSRDGESFLMEVLTTESQEEPWIFDSAATAHFCKTRDMFEDDFINLQNQNLTGAVDGQTTIIKGKGTVKLFFGHVEILLRNVMYTPELRRNLLSGPCIDQKGAKFVGYKGKIDIFRKNGNLLCSAKLYNGLYYIFPDKCLNLNNANDYYNQSNGVNNVNEMHNLNVSNNVNEMCNLNVSNNVNLNLKSSLKSKNKKPVKSVKFVNESLADWHAKLAHINVDAIVKTSKNKCVHGLPELKGAVRDCRPCKETKFKRVTFKPINRIFTQKPLELLHTDLCGPLPTTSIHGHRYFMTIIDDFSRKVFCFPLKSKAEALETFIKFQKRAERFLDCKIKNVRSDNGLEYVNEEFKKYCENLGINHQLTNVYTPEQNGVAERNNYTAVDGIKVLLRDSGLSTGFWSEALLHFVYSWNRVCHKGQTKTPFELYGGKQPSVKHMKPFGIQAYIGVPKNLRKKLDARAKPGILVGYALRTKGYRIWNPETRKIVETINVRFENKFPEKEKLKPETFEESELDPPTFRITRSRDIALGTDSEDEYQECPEILPKTEIDPEGEGSETKIDCERTAEPERGKRIVNWIRMVPREKGSSDIYYTEENMKTRLRSLGEIEQYCEKNNVKFQDELFDFSRENKFTGIVSGDQTPETSFSDTEFNYSTANFDYE